MTAKKPGGLRESARLRLANDHLIRSSMFQMASLAIASGFGLLYWIVAARRFPASAVGLGSAVVPAMSLLTVIAVAGLPAAVIMASPRLGSRRSAVMVKAMAVSAAMVAALTVVVVLVIRHGNIARLSHSPFGVALLVVGAASTATVADGWAIARRRTDLLLLRNLLATFIKLGLLFLPYPAIDGLPGGTAAILISWTVGFLLASVITGVRLYPDPDSSIGTEVSVARLSLVNWPTQLASQLPLYLLPLIVFVKLGAVANAHFYAAWNLAASLALIAPAVGQSLLAEGARHPELLGQQARSAMRLTFTVLAIPVASALALARPLLALFGHGYTDAAGLLRLLSLEAFPGAVVFLVAAVLRVRHRHQLAFLDQALVAIGSTGLCWLIVSSSTLTVGWIWLGVNLFVAIPGAFLLLRSASQ